MNTEFDTSTHEITTVYKPIVEEVLRNEINTSVALMAIRDVILVKTAEARVGQLLCQDNDAAETVSAIRISEGVVSIHQARIEERRLTIPDYLGAENRFTIAAEELLKSKIDSMGKNPKDLKVYLLKGEVYLILRGCLPQ